MRRWFVLLLAIWAVESVRAADVKRYQILKGRHYYQVAQNEARIQTNNAFRLTATVSATQVGDVLGAALYNPRGAGMPLEPDREGDPFRLRERFDDPGSLEFYWPNGGYTLTIQTAHDGNRSISYTISGDAYPNPPILSDLNMVHGVLHNRYTEISWKPFEGGTANDFIQVQIENGNGDNVFESPDFQQAGALNGLSTRVFLDPGVLDPATVYLGTVNFIRVQGRNSQNYPLAPGIAGYFSRTQFTIDAVTGGPVSGINEVQLWKTRQFDQAATGGPLLQEEPWTFTAGAETTARSLVTNISVTIPRAPTNVTRLLAGVAPDFEFSDGLSTNLQHFQTNFPAGVYRFNTRLSSGSTQQWSVTFPDGAFPPAPVMSNLNTIGVHEASRDLVLSWAPWTGSSELDFIRVKLIDAADGRVFDTPGFNKSNTLRPNVTSITIPAEVFNPGHSYQIELSFNKVGFADTGSIPGGFAFGGYSSESKFSFRTRASDVGEFGVSVGRIFWQHTADAVTPDPNGPFVFEARAEIQPVAVARADIFTPTGASLQLSNVFRGTNLSVTNIQGSIEGLQANFPAGQYSFRFETAHDGVKTVPVTLPASAFPPAPKVVNFTNLATLNPNASDLAVAWEPWVGARVGLDFVRIWITEANGQLRVETPANGRPLSVDGTRTSRLIGAGTLQGDRSYLVRVRFESVTRAGATNEYPGAIKHAAVFSETRYYISTLRNRFRMNSQGIGISAAGEIKFAVSPILPNRMYRLEATSDFRSWIDAGTFLTPAGTTPYVVTLPRDFETAFFRTVLLP